MAYKVGSNDWNRNMTAIKQVICLKFILTTIKDKNGIKTYSRNSGIKNQ